MSALPSIAPDAEALLKLDLAHKGYEQAMRTYREDVARENERLAAKHNAFIWTAQSVLYEAMGNAALAGFSPAEMVQTMGCSDH
jgi:hypothetical protein